LLVLLGGFRHGTQVLAIQRDPIVEVLVDLRDGQSVLDKAASPSLAVLQFAALDRVEPRTIENVQARAYPSVIAAMND
jgi:hypothetical protein